jgi:hypothetical protein
MCIRLVGKFRMNAHLEMKPWRQKYKFGFRLAAFAEASVKCVKAGV